MSSNVLSSVLVMYKIHIGNSHLTCHRAEQQIYLSIKSDRVEVRKLKAEISGHTDSEGKTYRLEVTVNIMLSFKRDITG